MDNVIITVLAIALAAIIILTFAKDRIDNDACSSAGGVRVARSCVDSSVILDIGGND